MDSMKICPSCNNQVSNNSKFCPYCGAGLLMTETRSDENCVKIALHQLQPNYLLNNRYRITQVLGEGNFGITYLADDTTLQMRVAIKEFYPKGYVSRESNVTANVTIYEGNKSEQIHKWKNNFINEARTLAKLAGQPGIVEVRDFFEQNGTAYIVMEYLDGDNLKNFIDKNGYVGTNDAAFGLGKRISVEQAKQMLGPVMKALQKVHEAGLVHRDISPDNIAITQNGSVKLFDFGAARQVDADGTNEKTIMLKLGYAPEEQYRKKGNQGPWTDVYALCATFYKCITGITPLESTERIYDDTLKKPSELGIQISQYDEYALMMGLAVYADKRFADMNALYRALYHADINSSVEERDTTKTMPLFEETNQMVNKSNVPIQSVSDKQKKSKTPVIVALVAGIFVIAAFGIGIVFLLLNGRPQNDTASDVVETDTREEREQDSVQEKTNQFTEYQEMLDNQNYKEVIEELTEIEEDNYSDDEIDFINQMLKDAINGQLNKSINDIDGLVANEQYEEAYQLISDEKSYFEQLMDKRKTAKYIESTQIFDDKENFINEMYIAYLLHVAEENATAGNEEGLREAFEKGESRFGNDVFDGKKAKVYRTLILTTVNRMYNESRSVEEVMSYIEQNQELCDYDLWVLEYWDTAYSMYRMDHSIPAWDSKVNHVSASGFILDYSNLRELSFEDLQDLSRYELYMARLEIYARHGRNFNDPTAQQYFDNCKWYSQNITFQDFYESDLSVIEKKNVDTIRSYEEYMGYRNCR